MISWVFSPRFFLLFFYLHKTKLKNCSNHIYIYVKLSFIQKMFYLQDWKFWFYLHVLSLVAKFEFSVCKIVTIYIYIHLINIYIVRIMTTQNYATVPYLFLFFLIKDAYVTFKIQSCWIWSELHMSCPSKITLTDMVWHGKYIYIYTHVYVYAHIYMHAIRYSLMYIYMYIYIYR